MNERIDYKMRYGPALAKQIHKVQKEIITLQKQINQKQKELLSLTDGLYDKPVSEDMLALHAMVAYIMSENEVTASAICKVPPRQIREWARRRNWVEKKKEHYELVEKMVDTHIAEQAETRAQVITGAYDRALGLLAAEIQDDELSELDRARAIESLVKAIDKLSSYQKEPEAEVNSPGLSAHARNILIQVQHRVPTEEAVDEIDALEAQFNELK